MQDLSKDLAKSVQEEEALMAAQGLIQTGANALGLTSTQRSVLQAMEILAQVWKGWKSGGLGPIM